MPISLTDVHHVAALARLRLTDAQAAVISAELTTILAHMDALSAVDATGVEETIGVGARGTPVRGDTGPSLPLARALIAFAPSMREGFLLVPRLASHDSVGEA